VEDWKSKTGHKTKWATVFFVLFHEINNPNKERQKYLYAYVTVKNNLYTGKVVVNACDLALYTSPVVTYVFICHLLIGGNYIFKQELNFLINKNKKQV